MPVVEKSPDQAIYDALYSICLNLGYDAYFELPDNNASYPFVFIGEIFEQSRSTKGHVFGDYQITLHIYHTEPKYNRKAVTDMREAIKREYYKLKRAYGYQMISKRHNGQIIIDTSTNIPLLHGILELDMTIN